MIDEIKHLSAATINVSKSGGRTPEFANFCNIKTRITPGEKFIQTPITLLEGNCLACLAADSFPFSGSVEIEQANKKQASEGACLGWAKKVGRSREEVSKKGEGVRRKGTTCLWSQTFYWTPFAHEWGAIVQFDWLVARQSNRGMKNLTLVRKRKCYRWTLTITP